MTSYEEPWNYEAADLVWHYTDAGALQNIITKNELWASDTNFMNDSYERRLADKYLVEERNRFEKAGNSFPTGLESYLVEVSDWYGTRNGEYDDPRYQISGSRNGDSLTMWRGYAGTNELSFAVGLDRRENLNILATDNANLGRAPEITNWFDVSYDPKAAKAEAKKAVEEIIESYSSGNENVGGEVIQSIDVHTEKLRNTTKHEGFIHEEEVRVVIKADSPGLVRFRAGRFGMVPYVALTGTGPIAGASSGRSVKRVEDQNHALPIREIRISPGTNRENARMSLRRLLDASGYSGAEGHRGTVINMPEIRLSDIPFR